MGEECHRAAECLAPLICCPDERCSRDLGCLEGGVVPYVDASADTDTDSDTDTDPDSDAGT